MEHPALCPFPQELVLCSFLLSRRWEEVVWEFPSRVELLHFLGRDFDDVGHVRELNHLVHRF